MKAIQVVLEQCLPWALYTRRGSRIRRGNLFVNLLHFGHLFDFIFDKLWLEKISRSLYICVSTSLKDLSIQFKVLPCRRNGLIISNFSTWHQEMLFYVQMNKSIRSFCSFEILPAANVSIPLRSKMISTRQWDCGPAICKEGIRYFFDSISRFIPKPVTF